MNLLLTRLLNKRGIKREDLDLNSHVPGFPSEKEQFEKWESILSGEGVTLEKISDFCKAQVEIIESRWADFNVPQEKKAELIKDHTFYKTFLKKTKAPEVERVELEKYLNDLIK